MSVKPKILGLIPARGNSKRLPGKNIREFHGQPLLAWTIKAAQQSQQLSHVILSSEDEALIKVAQRYQCDAPFVRPKELSQDYTPGIDPVLHALEQCPGYDYIVLLQPTSPLRTSEDIDKAVQLCIETNAPALVSVSVTSMETCKNPEWCYRLDPDNHLVPLDFPSYHGPIMQLNGAVFVAKVDWLQCTHSFISSQTQAYVMPIERASDIDTLEDFEHAGEMVVDLVNG